MPPHPSLAEQAPPRRGQLQLLLIVALVIGPMLLAGAMYRWQFWIPASRSYHGELLGDGRTLADLGIRGVETERWRLLVTAPDDCGADCRELVYLARQINIALGREAGRAAHALATARPLAGDVAEQLERAYPRLEHHHWTPPAFSHGTQLWIADPHGNLVLRYAPGSSGKAILEDLRHLLKLSHIG